MDRDTRPTLEDVARTAGVSPATASRALSRPDIVQAGTVARVRQAAESLRYVPGGAARALASGRSRTMGAVVPTLDHAIFARAIQEMQTALALRGYQLLIASHEYSLAQEVVAVRAMLARGVDGLMIVGADHAEETWELLRHAKAPVVVSWSFQPEFDSIGFDNELCGQLVAEHLVALGHRQFGMISGATRANDRARRRVAGVRRALAAHGIELPDACVSEQPFSLTGGRAGLMQLLGLSPTPTAVICGNDLLAVGALFEAQSRGLAVPEQLSLAGIDNLEFAGHVLPPLTTVHLPTAELGRALADHLLARVNGEACPRRREMAIELVVRRSTGPVPARADRARIERA